MLTLCELITIGLVAFNPCEVDVLRQQYEKKTDHHSCRITMRSSQGTVWVNKTCEKVRIIINTSIQKEKRNE